VKNESINYGNIIKTLRKKNNLNQTELGAKLSIGKTAIANYESGYSIPSAPVLEKIAAVFGMSLIQLLMTGQEQQSGNQNYDKINEPRYEQFVNTMTIRYITPSEISVSTVDMDRYGHVAIAVPGNMFEDQNSQYFFTKMTDNSMESDNIKKNDYIFVRKTDNIRDHQIVFAIDTATNEYYIRRYMRDNHIFTLIPSSLSPEFSIIREDSRETTIKIVGCVEKSLISFP